MKNLFLHAMFVSTLLFSITITAEDKPGDKEQSDQQEVLAVLTSLSQKSSENVDLVIRDMQAHFDKEVQSLEDTHKRTWRKIIRNNLTIGIFTGYIGGLVSGLTVGLIALNRRQY